MYTRCYRHGNIAGIISGYIEHIASRKAFHSSWNRASMMYINCKGFNPTSEGIRFNLSGHSFFYFCGLSQLLFLIGGFHSILIPRKTLEAQLCAYCRFMSCGREQISLNCIYFQLNISSILMINISLDSFTVLRFGGDLQVLNISRD